MKNFVSRQRWRLVRLRLKSCCSFPGFLWTLAAASCSPKAGLVKPRTTSSWLTPTVCGRSEQVHRTSRRGRRCAGLVGIKWKIRAFCCWINSLSGTQQTFASTRRSVLHPPVSGGTALSVRKWQSIWWWRPDFSDTAGWRQPESETKEWAGRTAFLLGVPLQPFTCHCGTIHIPQIYDQDTQLKFKKIWHYFSAVLRLHERVYWFEWEMLF